MTKKNDIVWLVIAHFPDRWDWKYVHGKRVYVKVEEESTPPVASRASREEAFYVARECMSRSVTKIQKVLKLAVADEAVPYLRAAFFSVERYEPPKVAAA